MCTIALTKGYFAIVDSADYATLIQHVWFARVRTHTVYAVCNMYGENGKRYHVQMHRMLLNPTPVQEVDHINHNGLDNRRSNLRICSRSENAKNRALNHNNASGYKGVNWHSGKWRAYIQADGNLQHLGSFEILEDAARAYDSAALSLFGEFATTNF